jgi:hypothetical protein
MIKSIGLKHDKEKKAKRNRMILGVSLIFIMFFSVVAYAIVGLVDFSSPEIEPNTETKTYNGFEFSNQAGFWFLEKDSRSFIFRNHPDEIQELNSEIKSLEEYSDKVLYISSEDELAEAEVRTNIFYFVEKIERVNFEDNCEENFIVIREANKNNIFVQENCIFIEGEKENLVKLTDSFLFKLLGIQ